MPAPAVNIGTTFHYPYADGNPLWRVVKARGDGTWDCVVDQKEPDWAGTKKVFGSEEISRSISASAMWDRLADRHDDFWAGVKEGQTVHYHYGFGQYVRGVVVRGEHHGKRGLVMRPVAVVGAWREYDLPRWYDTGTYSEGCHAVRMIAAGETMQPNSTSMLESADFVPPRGPTAGFDPTGVAPIDLTPPLPTPEQAETARLLGIVEAIRVAVSHKDGHPVTDFAEEYRSRIMEAARILANARLVPDEGEPGPKF